MAAALLAGLTLAPRCAVPSRRPPAAMTAQSVATPAPAPAAADTAFRETIRPILSARCGKCHDPGGRMYARLPFDDPRTVSSHSAGVLRRLKGDDRAALERWLAELASAPRPR